MPEPKNRTYQSTLRASPALRLKTSDPARNGYAQNRGDRLLPAGQADSLEIREDLLNRLIEAIKSI